MKIIIACTIVPFAGSEDAFIVEALEQKLRENSHQVDVVQIPFSPNIKDILPQITALRLYHLENECERLICVGMPSCLIHHPHKLILFTQPYHPETHATKEFIMRAYKIAFSEAKETFTVSRNISDKNGIDISLDSIVRSFTQ
jgi:hypothetical protein